MALTTSSYKKFGKRIGSGLGAVLDAAAASAEAARLRDREGNQAREDLVEKIKAHNIVYPHHQVELGEDQIVYVNPTPARKCSNRTPVQVCEDRDCFWHRDDIEGRDFSRLR